MNEERIFQINGYSDQKFCQNIVINSKYTVWNFIPKIVFHHCRRFMNFYFILIGCLQLWKTVSPVNPLTAWVPICIIFAIAIIREGIDDYNQHKLDKIINKREYLVIRNFQVERIPCQDIQVGDIIYLDEKNECPADIALLTSTNDNGSVSIETSSLDGETTLKEVEALRINLILTNEALYSTANSRSNSCFNLTANSSASLSSQLLPTNPQSSSFTNDDILTAFTCEAHCNLPNSDLYSFEGHLEFEGKNIQLRKENFVPRGARIQCVNHVAGFVCYTGKDTKLCLNQQPPKVKWTSIEKFISKVAFYIFVAQIIISIIGGQLANYVEKHKDFNKVYLRYDLGQDLPNQYTWLLLIVRVYLLTTSMIPISLKLTIDLCKFIYQLIISSDFYLNEGKTNTKKIVNNSSVTEDLGSVKYAFCDKTGTLTKNVMTFKKIGIDQRYFGHSPDYDSISIDETFKQAILEKDPIILNIITCLILCNTVKYKSDKSIYGQSPEEIAFITFLREIGFKISMEKIFYQTDDGNHQWDSFQYTISNPELDFAQRSYELVQMLPFSHNRQRMSVLVKDMTDSNQNLYYLYMKGGPDVLYNICDSPYNCYQSQVDALASQGLRILGIAYKELDYDTVNRFINEYVQLNDILDKDGLASSLESNSSLIGCVAVEDELQDRVAHTIKQLRKAGLKFWMLTGDIFPTAMNISYSTSLVTSKETFIHIKIPENSHNYQISDILDNIIYYADSLLESGKTFSLGIDNYYEFLLSDQLQSKFIDLALKATTVICAHTTPKIKADMVVSVKKKTRDVVLTIGDGGNDVSMIRASDIGIGITGANGDLASNASDFSIEKFSHLERLLLVHGRYSYYRTAWLTQFCFYKSLLFCLIQVLFMTQNSFSGSSYFSQFNLMTYNAFFTILPVIFFLQDKDIEESTVLLHPSVYQDSQLHRFCNVKTIMGWFFRGLYQACILSYLSFTLMDKNYYHNADGSPISLDESQQITYSAIIFIIILTVALSTKHFTSLNLIFIWGNWVVYIILTVGTNCVSTIGVVKDMYLVMWRVMANIVNWILLFTMISAAIFPPYFIECLFYNLRPSTTQQLREYEIKKESQFLPVYLDRASPIPDFDQLSISD